MFGVLCYFFHEKKIDKRICPFIIFYLKNLIKFFYFFMCATGISLIEKLTVNTLHVSKFILRFKYETYLEVQKILSIKLHTNLNSANK